MKPYFLLRPYKDADDYQQIQLYYFNKGKKLRLDSGVKTKAIYWKDTFPQRITSRATDIKQNPDELNRILNEKLHKLEGIIQDYQKKNKELDPPVDFVKEEYYKEQTKILNDQEVKQQLEDWIPKKHQTTTYIKIYNTILNDLKEFHPKPLYYRDINKKFWEELMNYWMNRKTEKKNGERTEFNLQDSTINKRWKCFKLFLLAKYETGENEYNHFKDFKTGLTNVPTTKIVIPTKQEFSTICNKEIKNKYLENTRDLYVIACSTGLRYSDVIELTPSNIHTINNKHYLIIDVVKTQQKDLRIPLNEVAITFLKKQFSNGGIKYISNKEINNHLHDLLKEFEIDTPTAVYRKSGNKVIKTVVPKYEAMSFHSARKFFISFCVNSKKVSLGNVMKWSGHKNLSVVKSYIDEGYDQEDEMNDLYEGIVLK